MKLQLHMIWGTFARWLLLSRIFVEAGKSSSAQVQELPNEASELSSRPGATILDYNLAAGLLEEAVRLTIDEGNNITEHRSTLTEIAKTLENAPGGLRNLSLSLHLFRKAAELGDPKAHGEMGTRFSYGLQDESTAAPGKLIGFSKSDLPQALLHYTFGAFGNDAVSHMALGYRHMTGHGAPQSCPTAVSYYNAAAERVLELGRVPGALPHIEKVRLSVRSLQGLRSAREQQWLQFYQSIADMGDVDAQAAVGELFLYGTHGLERDYQQALHYFRQAADAGDAGAMSHLGHMYANGVGVERNNDTALEWFKSATAKNHPNGHYGLGYMYLSGYGVEKDLKVAAQHFQKAAEMNHPEAQYHYGMMHLHGWVPQSPTSPHQALQLFQAAAQSGHLFAMYNLAMMYLSGIGSDQPNCQPALRLLKQVAERGEWCQVLQQGHDAFAKRDTSLALLSYLRAAQMGLELGQSNAAWMLEHGLGPGSQRENILLALELYKSSAEQDNKEALLSIGDIYYYGRGVEKDWRQAAAVYRQAFEKRNARAAFNLGYMHQYGAGLPQDLHLAKRFYDHAYDYEPDGYYATSLAVLFLNVHSWWNQVRPYIPVIFRSIVDRLFRLGHGNAASVPTPWWSGHHSEPVGSSGVMDGIMNAMDIDAVGDFFQYVFGIYDKDEVGEFMETLVLGVLVVVFMVVFRRRHQTRGNAQARNTGMARRGNGVVGAPRAVANDMPAMVPQAQATVSTSRQPSNPAQGVEQVPTVPVDSSSNQGTTGTNPTTSMSAPDVEGDSNPGQEAALLAGSDPMLGSHEVDSGAAGRRELKEQPADE
ncbi:unnamed protein product [Ostreobium quekettii]|uniref:Uncharacterized protein n=1 Tax=Ostreobium quekettii TaxID=121088 RepID=A0A8S1IVG6_9CHLO|nr:unnamed protein product [Ostreobium quekettii]|eukprot:evm.model.scf_927.1 EVM.evm.TU.scf_927.1   scf_927:23385-30424(+)